MIPIVTLLAIAAMVASQPQTAAPSLFSSPPAFESAPLLEPDAYIQSAAAGDFNEDGSLDLALAERDSSQVVVFLGRGDGTFLARHAYSVVGVPCCVGEADLDGDGHLDLAVGANSDLVFIFRGDGSGTFQTPRSFSVMAPPLSIALGDLDGDSRIDVVTGNATTPGIVEVLWNQGQGSFDVDSAYATADKPLGVTLADFNGDGILDIGASALGHTTCCYHVSVLLGSGQRSFAASQNYPSGFWPRAIAAGDVNGDGWPDLAAADEQGGLLVLLNNRDGTFTTKGTGWSNSGQDGLAFADFDADGKLDVAVATLSDMELGHGLGDGTFTLMDTLSTVHAVAQVVVADVNHDTRPDVIGAGRGAFTFLNTTPTVSAQHLLSALAFEAPAPNPAQRSILFSFQLPHDGPVSLAIFDVAGHLVRSLVSGMVPAGPRSATWDLRDQSNRAVVRGMYFARLKYGAEEIVKKVEVLH